MKTRMKTRTARKTTSIVIGLLAGASLLLSGCSGDDAAKIDPSTQNTGNVVAGLSMTGSIELHEDEGTIDKVGNVGESVDYSFVVKNVSKTKLTGVGVSTTQGQMWCKSADGKTEGKALDLEAGAELKCSTAGLPDAVTKDAEVAKAHKITAEDVTAKVFEVIAKGHGQNPEAKQANAKIVVAEPLALKVAVG